MKQVIGWWNHWHVTFECLNLVKLYYDWSNLTVAGFQDSRFKIYSIYKCNERPPAQNTRHTTIGKGQTFTKTTGQYL